MPRIAEGIDVTLWCVAPVMVTAQRRRLDIQCGANSRLRFRLAGQGRTFPLLVALSSAEDDLHRTVEMETRDVKGIPVEIHGAGSGPPLIYLHAEQYFEQVRPYLDALAKKWTVIAPRHPGYGAASKTADLRSVDDLAYLYLDLLDELKLDKVVLVGTSFGGWIALEMCVRNHARLSKLVLIS
jgi:pimeloyl-ACP methyl ester carboxylesterase